VISSATACLFITGVAALGSLGLALLVLARPPRRLAQWSFAAGMLAFAGESLAVQGLLLVSDSPETHQLWATASQVLGLVLPWPWALFAFALGRRPGAPIPTPWKIGFSAGGALLLAGIALTLHRPALAFLPDPGPFTMAYLTPVGQIATVLQLLATVAVLYGLEPSLRRSSGVIRWRVKFLALGLSAVFAIRFYLLSQTLLFRVIPAPRPLTAVAALVIGNLLVAVSLSRTRRLGVDLTVSRHIVYRSVAVAVTGAYLILAGLAGWILRDLGVPEAIFWGTLAIFISSIGAAALLLSEDLRYRVKRYINTHFYRSKYDYREQWRTFTARLSSRVTRDSLIPELLGWVSDAAGAQHVTLYLHDDRDGPLRLAGSLGGASWPSTLDVVADAFLPARRGRQAWPIEAWVAREEPGDGSRGPALDALGGGRVAALVSLPRHGRLLGLLLVGRARSDEPYSSEDLDLLATAGEQAAAVLAGTAASERLAQSRAFEAFHQLSSFVVHDIKNAVSALSLLTRNALEHFDEPEFQRDAIKTLSRTVDRMKALLVRLSPSPDGIHLSLDEVDLATMLSEMAPSLVAGTRVVLARDLEPVPAILGDLGALERIFQNLMKNAIEAMDGEGQLRLRTRVDDGHVACAVTDTGCGMSAEFLQKSLFVPFQSTKKGGWGVGLYQVKQIVEAHRGRIEVASQEGRGTTFTVLFPVPGQRES
jgi:putative PEP-CTERM system histidine kinase